MKIYKCECGKEFDNLQRFNGHKCHCLIHLKSVNKLESFFEAEKKRHNSEKVKRLNKERRESAKAKKQKELEK